MTIPETYLPPFMHTARYATSGLGEQRFATMNVYNARGTVIARAKDEETAEMIAAALNNYKPEN